MPINDRIVRVLITGDASKFNAAVKDVERSVLGSGGFGKAIQFARANAAGLAATATAMATALAVDSANAFKEAGLGAKRFGEATGISTESASRWIEVAGDLGIEAAAVQTAFGRLAKAIGNDGGALDDLGVAAARTASGIVDIDETMRRAIEALNAIEDPTQRAAAGAELFGKGWQTVVRLGPDVRSQLDDVADGIAISDEEARKAQGMRDLVDELADGWASVKNELGEFVYDATVKLADLGLTFRQWAYNILNFLEGIPIIGGPVDNDTLDDMQAGIKAGREELKNLGKGASDAATEIADLGEEAVKAASKVKSLVEANLDYNAALRSVADSQDNILAAIEDLDEPQERVRRAEQAHAAALRDLTDAQADASRGHQDEANRLRDLAVAQERVSQARRDGQRDVERAEIALADARRELQKAGNSNDSDGFKDALDRVRLAELDLEEAREGSQSGVLEAERDLADLRAESAESSADRIADALIRVDETSKELAAAQLDRQRAEEAAWRDVAAAVDERTAAELRLAQVEKDRWEAATARWALTESATGPSSQPWVNGDTDESFIGPRVSEATNIWNVVINEVMNGARLAEELNRELGRTLAGGGGGTRAHIR
jgi:hypothetical protein